MAPPYRISWTQDVAGSWFFLWNPEGARWFIERIVLWALVEADGEYDHVRAVGSLGMVLPPETIYGSYEFVYGSDKSPMGPTWDDIYAAAKHSLRDPCREITEAVRGAP